MDPYQSPDTQSDEAIAAMTTRLEDRGTNADFQGMIDDYLADIPADRSIAVLDLGCGTGVVTRRLTEHLHPGSRLHGADISERFLDEARRRSGKAEIRWDLVEGDALPYEDGAFDFVIMHTLLTHVPDPVATLREAGRVLKDGGRIIAFDADYASTTYAYPDRETMREIDYRLLSAVAANIDVCRQLPRLIREAGLVLSRHRAYVLSEAGRGDFWLSSVEGFARLIPALEILPEEQGREWVEHMRRSHEQGTFFASSNYYTFTAEKTGGEGRGN